MFVNLRRFWKNDDKLTFPETFTKILSEKSISIRDEIRQFFNTHMASFEFRWISNSFRNDRQKTISDETEHILQNVGVVKFLIIVNSWISVFFFAQIFDKKIDLNNHKRAPK